MKATRKTSPKLRPAEVLREYGPFPDTDDVAGVTYDGKQVWFARGESLIALNPKTGKLGRELAVPAHAGTAFDGKHLWQIADDRISKIDPRTGRVLATIPAPGKGRDSGLTWAEGTLWVGEYRARKIHQVDVETGAVLRTIKSDRFVTGVSWDKGELWHATMDENHSELRHVDPQNGDVLESYALPAGMTVSGLESDGRGTFYCGGASSGKVRAVRKPKR